MNTLARHGQKPNPLILSMSNLSTVVKSIQDIMRQDSGVDGDALRQQLQAMLAQSLEVQA